jgi:DNA-directed RNA polymerase subunit RPC12/RpoP
MVSWEITEGAIEQNYLSIAKPKKARLIPADGSEFEVETSEGQVFRTDIIVGRLRERAEIRKFYKMANIKPGDKVVWREIVPFKRYHLSKK